ncbi:assimilatory nitrate reductase large subunit [Vibrio ishigakensis]|uniref:Assimilatory nitrate reductase large subunit n=1 Tax=Vibrio ishigakensis TaxID=1481914 RepID=A0A0B8QI76_9VIBR|nr:assimilatory nitrate reductase large subunit [Vibrio ishigakensis]
MLGESADKLEMMLKQLFIPIHWNESTAKQSKPCSLIVPNSDEFSGQPEFKHTPVTLEPVKHQSSALFFTRTPIELDECDYWARQKIEKGYLYRIESKLAPYELSQVLKGKLSDRG